MTSIKLKVPNLFSQRSKHDKYTPYGENNEVQRNPSITTLSVAQIRRKPLPLARTSQQRLPSGHDPEELQEQTDSAIQRDANAGLVEQLKAALALLESERRREKDIHARDVQRLNANIEALHAAKESLAKDTLEYRNNFESAMMRRLEGLDKEATKKKQENEVLKVQLAKAQDDRSIYYNNFLKMAEDTDTILSKLKLEKAKQNIAVKCLEEERKESQSKIQRMEQDFQKEIQRRAEEEKKQSQLLLQKINEERNESRNKIQKMTKDFQKEIERQVEEEKKRSQLLIQKIKEECQNQHTLEQKMQELQTKVGAPVNIRRTHGPFPSLFGFFLPGTYPGIMEDCDLNKLTSSMITQMQTITTQFTKNYPVKKIEYIMNDSLYQQFQDTRSKFRSMGRGTHEIIAYHGTARANINRYYASMFLLLLSILSNGFFIGGVNGHPVSHGSTDVLI